MFNCKKLHHKCHAECCKTFPIPENIYYSNQDKIITKPLEIKKIPSHGSFEGESKNCIFPITETMDCVFLNDDLSCNIYDQRPAICRLFGGESHPQLCCSWQDKNGNIRSRQNKRLIERNQHKNTLQTAKLFEIYG